MERKRMYIEFDITEVNEISYRIDGMETNLYLADKEDLIFRTRQLEDIDGGNPDECARTALYRILQHVGMIPSKD